MNLDRLLHPGAIALIGGGPALNAAAQCRDLGFDGDVWLVNPNRSDAYSSLADLPSIPDAALVAVGRERVPQVVAELAEMGCGGAVCYSAGFAEADDLGRELQDRMLSAAGKMPVIGPNCHGFINALSGAALWPDVQGVSRVDRGVGIVTQSGNIAISLTMQQRALPIAFMVTLGNQASVRIEDVLEAMVADERVSAIGAHIEGLTDPNRLPVIASSAAAVGKPIVVLKTGRSAKGSAIARTHTASMAGSAETYDALFARYGIGQVETIPEFLSTLGLFHFYGRLPGPRLVSLSCSGGEAGLVADRAQGKAIEFPEFSPDSVEALSLILDHKVAISNPFDYHTFIWGDRERMTACFAEALTSPVDAGMLILDFPAPGLDHSGWQPTLEAWIDAHRATGRPVVVTATLPENLPLTVAERLAAVGIPISSGIDETLRAFEVASAPARVGSAHLEVAAPAGIPRRLDDTDARRRLGDWVKLPAFTEAPIDTAGEAADGLGYPVVIKAMGLDHKSDVGGVLLGLGDRQEVEAAATQMAPLAATVLVERMATGIVAELVVAVRRQTPIGWAVTVGSGGVLVELIDDVAVALAPVTKGDLMAMLGTLRISKLLEGHRGRPGADRGLLAEAIVAIVDAALAHPDTVELEVNPLAVTTDGPVALDVLWLVES